MWGGLLFPGWRGPNCYLSVEMAFVRDRLPRVIQVQPFQGRNRTGFHILFFKGRVDGLSFVTIFTVFSLHRSPFSGFLSPHLKVLLFPLHSLSFSPLPNSVRRNLPSFPNFRARTVVVGRPILWVARSNRRFEL